MFLIVINNYGSSHNASAEEGYVIYYNIYIVGFLLDCNSPALSVFLGYGPGVTKCFAIRIRYHDNTVSDLLA